jgi:hypothetical protein
MTLQDMLALPNVPSVILVEVSVGVALEAWITNTDGNTFTCQVPQRVNVESLQYNGTVLTLVTGTPTAAGQWSQSGQAVTVFPPTGTTNIYNDVVIGFAGFYFSDTSKVLNGKWYEDRVKSIPKLQMQIEARFSGAMQFGQATVQLLNGDGYFDGLDDLLWDNGLLTVKYGVDLPGTPMDYSGYATVAAFALANFERDNDMATIQVKERKTRLAQKLPATFYDSDTYPNMDATLAGTVIPMIYGHVFSAEVTVLDPGTGRCKACSNAVVDFPLAKVKRSIQTISPLNPQFIADPVHTGLYRAAASNVTDLIVYSTDMPQFPTTTPTVPAAGQTNEAFTDMLYVAPSYINHWGVPVVPPIPAGWTVSPGYDFSFKLDTLTGIWSAPVLPGSPSSLGGSSAAVLDADGIFVVTPAQASSYIQVRNLRITIYVNPWGAGGAGGFINGKPNVPKPNIVYNMQRVDASNLSNITPGTWGQVGGTIYAKPPAGVDFMNSVPNSMNIPFNSDYAITSSGNKWGTMAQSHYQPLPKVDTIELCQTTGCCWALINEVLYVNPSNRITAIPDDYVVGQGGATVGYEVANGGLEGTTIPVTTLAAGIASVSADKITSVDKWMPIGIQEKFLDVGEFIPDMTEWDGAEELAVDVIGKPGLYGEVMENPAEVVRDLLEQIGETSFDDAAFAATWAWFCMSLNSDGTHNHQFKIALNLDTQTDVMQLVSDINMVAATYLLDKFGKWSFQAVRPQPSTGLQRFTDDDFYGTPQKTVNNDKLVTQVDAYYQYRAAEDTALVMSIDDVRAQMKHGSPWQFVLQMGQTPSSVQLIDRYTSLETIQDLPLYDPQDVTAFIYRELAMEGVPLVEEIVNLHKAAMLVLPGGHVVVDRERDGLRVMEVIGAELDLNKKQVKLTLGNNRGWADSCGYWVADSAPNWDASLTDKQKKEMICSSGFWTNDNSMANEADPKSYKISRWWP